MILILNIEKIKSVLYSPKIDKIRGMSMKAVGAYLHTLREHHDLTLTEIAKKLKTSSSLIFRVEQGQGETRGSILLGFTRLVEGSPDDIANLLLNPNASVEDGQTFAVRRVNQLASLAPEPTSVHPDILHLIEQLSPYDLGKWVVMGQNLLGSTKNK